MHQSFSTFFNSIGKKYTPCQGVVWSLYSLPGTFYVPLGFGVVLFAKVCFFLPVQFSNWKAVDFTLALLYPNFKLQYLMNYSSDFNNFCRFQLLAVCRVKCELSKRDHQANGPIRDEIVPRGTGRYFMNTRRVNVPGGTYIPVGTFSVRPFSPVGDMICWCSQPT